MKKLIKFLLAAGAVIGGVMGVIYYLDKRKGDDFEDFDEDDFDDIFDDDDRDYVTLDFEEEKAKKEDEEDSEEEKEE